MRYFMMTQTHIFIIQPFFFFKGEIFLHRIILIYSFSKQIWLLILSS